VEGGVHVFTQDGSVYTGDLVVGADGVHSKVRSEMWRIAHAAITPREKSSAFWGEAFTYRSCLSPHCLLLIFHSPSGMKMRFASIFGVSSPVPGLTLGEQIVHCSDGLTIFLGVCRDYRVQYFITIDQGHTFTTPNIPRYTDDDARAASDRIKDTQILPGVRWGDIWSRRETFAMVALEETLFETWNFDRLVCIGDSMIKVDYTRPKFDVDLQNTGRSLLTRSRLDDSKCRPGSQLRDRKCCGTLQRSP
jgi:2-polyprenyl-6-methoxyphenol hydroxylase-like FAD-dependent oxidoreductase